MNGLAIATKALLANSEVARFTLRFQGAPLPVVADLQALAEDVAGDIAGLIKPLYCADITAFSVSAQLFTHVPAAGSTPAYWGPASVEFSNTTAIGPGTHVGESLPPQNALVCTLRTALPGPSKRGRVYGFPPPESVVGATGQLVAAHDFAGLVEAICSFTRTAGLALPTPADLTESVFSAKLNSAEPIIAFSQGNRIDTQRRRLARTG